MGNTHGSAAQHIARTHEYGKPAKALYRCLGLFGVCDVEPARLIDIELIEQGTELSPIFGLVDVYRVGPQDLHARSMQAHREVIRDLAAHADDNAVGAFFLV